MDDPYKILGLSKSAAESEIKSAYRKLAKKHHPDMHPDDPKMADKFKEISAAYMVLSDPDLKRRYDAGEIDANGQETAKFRYEYAGGRGGPGRAGFGFDFNNFDPQDIFNEFFSSGRGQRRQQGPVKGGDRHYSIKVDFLDAANGMTQRITMPSGKTLDVRIPAGIESGKQIRLKGQGHDSPNGAAAGDALIEVSVRPHQFFERDDSDIRIEVPVTLYEAVLGAKVEVPTIDGTVSMTIPKNSDSGTVLRLKGRGLNKDKSSDRGDQYIKIRIALPANTDPELERVIGEWAQQQQYDPRKDLK
jgi:DnaJ-class molecular chaperone